MKRLRIWFAAFFLWLFVFYNIERLHEPINLASFIYVLAAASALPLVLIPQLHRIPSLWLLGASVPLTIGMKLWFGYAIGGRLLPITITEIVSIWVTMSLALQLGRSLEDLRTAALSALLVHLRDRTRSFDQGQAEIYREISRARRHGRPLALLAIAVSDESIDLSLDRFTAELQQESVRNYVHARLAELLSMEMKDCDVISQHGTHFVTVVPEAGREHALVIANKLKRAALDRLGVELRVGVSLFPEEEVTFVQLLERAQAQLQNSLSKKLGMEEDPVADSWPPIDLSEVGEALDRLNVHSPDVCQDGCGCEEASPATVRQEA